MKVTPYTHVHDKNGARGDGLVDSTIKYSCTLLATVIETVTAPSESNYWAVKIVIGTSSNVWLAINSTVEAAVGNTFLPTTSELIPNNKEVIRRVKAGQVLEFITTDTSADISLAFYAL